MSDLMARVCPRCGAGVGEHEYCQTCGLHLTQQPELPTRAEWEESRTKERWHGDLSPARALERRWRSAPRSARISVASLAAVLVLVIGLLALIGGSDESGSDGLASNDPQLDESASSSPPPEQACVDLWNNSDGNHLSRISSLAEGGGEVLASVGFSAEFPDRCLVTIVFVDRFDSLTIQFQESQADLGGPLGGPFRELGFGPVTEFPDSAKQYNATVSPEGTLVPDF